MQTSPVSSLELGFIVFVGAVVLGGTALSLYVAARAYFGGQKRIRPRPSDPES